MGVGSSKDRNEKQYSSCKRKQDPASPYVERKKSRAIEDTSTPWITIELAPVIKQHVHLWFDSATDNNWKKIQTLSLESLSTIMINCKEAMNPLMETQNSARNFLELLRFLIDNKVTNLEAIRIVYLKRFMNILGSNTPKDIVESLRRLIQTQQRLKTIALINSEIIKDSDWISVCVFRITKSNIFLKSLMVLSTICQTSGSSLESLTLDKLFIESTDQDIEPICNSFDHLQVLSELKVTQENLSNELIILLANLKKLKELKVILSNVQSKIDQNSWERIITNCPELNITLILTVTNYDTLTKIIDMKMPVACIKAKWKRNLDCTPANLSFLFLSQIYLVSLSSIVVKVEDGQDLQERIRLLEDLRKKCPIKGVNVISADADRIRGC
uniref:Uncharacterized protein n=1 Tax=Biomphalaria glabrata TaxID=6526 RepID=A0A2C9KJR9_BIOGL